MPTPAKGPRMGGSPAHERLMLANLATSLFEHGRITTTLAKAKRLRPYAEHLITFGKRGDLHARRQVLKRLNDKSVVHTLFAEIGPRYADRPGGYTRILKVGNRKGDNAPMAIIELVEATTVGQQAVGEAERARGTKVAPRKAPTGATRESAKALAADSPTAASVAAAPAPGAPDAGADTDTGADAGATASVAAAPVLGAPDAGAGATIADDAAARFGATGVGPVSGAGPVSDTDSASAAGAASDAGSTSDAGSDSGADAPDAEVAAAAAVAADTPAAGTASAPEADTGAAGAPAAGDEDQK